MPKRGQLTADNIYTATEAYARTLKRTKELRQSGWMVEEIWECEYENQLKTDPTMKSYTDNIKIMDPLDPREAFFGGRTNAVKLYHKILRGTNNEPLEKISYTDICSLYPTVNKYGEYPIGHPKIFTENFKHISAIQRPYNGLIKATVLPPRNLYHPLLPMRYDGKLLFTLCRTCAEEKQQTTCQHNTEDRSITGTWVTIELYKALELGYQLLETHEIWHYEKIEKYDKTTNPDGGLLRSYIDKFMKQKQEADGWPSWAVTEEQKRAYIQQYKEKEGIELDYDNIKKNPGRRQLAKIMLNSFWGKVSNSIP